jgi:hypothetical protein
MWVALSLCWVAAVGLFSYSQIASPSLEPQAYVMDEPSGFFKLSNIFDQFDAGFKEAHWEVHFPNNVTLFVKTDIPKAVAEEKSPAFYEQYSKPRDPEFAAARLKAVEMALATSFVPPLVLLVLGLVIGWIAGGFKPTAP